MLTRLISILALAVLASITQPVAAQDGKISVEVSHSGEDTVGQRFAFTLRESIRSSKGYQLVSGPKATYRINLVTLNPEKSDAFQGNWTIAAVTFTMKNTNPFNERKPQTWYPIYLTSSVVAVGADRVDEQAQSILAALEAEIEAYRSDMRTK